MHPSNTFLSIKIDLITVEVQFVCTVVGGIVSNSTPTIEIKYFNVHIWRNLKCVQSGKQRISISAILLVFTERIRGKFRDKIVQTHVQINETNKTQSLKWVTGKKHRFFLLFLIVHVIIFDRKLNSIKIKRAQKKLIVEINFFSHCLSFRCYRKSKTSEQA